MRLGLRWLSDVGGINSWSYTSQPDFFEADAQTLYFQLVNEEATGNAVGTLSPAFGLLGSPVSAVPRRYVPAAGATLTVTLDSIDAARVITRVVSQPFPGDGSIWRLDLTSADGVRGTVDLRLALNEAGVQHSAVVPAALRVRSTARI